MEFNATLIGEIIAFAILIAFSVKFIWPPLLDAIEERQNKIAEGLAHADKARKELSDADARAAEEIKKARAEAAQIVDRAHQQATQIVDKARQDAVVEATKQKAIADADIEAQTHKAREELRGKVAALAVAGAEKILHREIDANVHKTLIDELVAGI